MAYEIAGFLLALVIFIIFWSVGIMLSKPRQMLFPSASAFFGTVIIYYMNLKNAVIWLIFEPMALAFSGETLTLFQSSGLAIAIGLLFIVLVALVNAISSFTKDGSLELWQ